MLPPKPGLNRISIAIIVGGVLIAGFMAFTALQSITSMRDVKERMARQAQWQSELPLFTFENPRWQTDRDLAIDVIFRANSKRTTDDLKISHFSLSKIKSNPAAPVDVPAIEPGKDHKMTFTFRVFPGSPEANIDFTLQSRSERPIYSGSNLKSANRKYHVAAITLPPKP